MVIYNHSTNKGKNDQGNPRHHSLDSRSHQHAAAGELTSHVEMQKIYQSIFPPSIQEEIVYAFGYGSGVFSQKSTENDGTTSGEATAITSTKKNMLDFMVAVKDAKKFHRLNTNLNPHHYPTLLRLGSGRLASWWQCHDISSLVPRTTFLNNPNVYFNLVDAPFVKYGVIQVADLCSDLQHWDSLYVAGRMQKPTYPLTIPEPYQSAHDMDLAQRIIQAQTRHNLPAAVAAALLLLQLPTAGQVPSDTCRKDENCAANPSVGTTLSTSALYEKIASLSYTGDVRIQLGAEDPQKVTKLVQSPGQLDRFHQLYWDSALRPLISEGILSLLTERDSASSTCLSPSSLSRQQQSSLPPPSPLRLTWDSGNPLAVHRLWQRLPSKLHGLERQSTSSSRATESLHALQMAIHFIVAPAARYQSFKGLVTAGFMKSARYAVAKLSKGVLRPKSS